MPPESPTRAIFGISGSIPLSTPASASPTSIFFISGKASLPLGDLRPYALVGIGFGYSRAEIEQKTGLQAVNVPSTEGAYLGKVHRGYRVLYSAKAGDVWGRYAARLTLGEIGREVGGVMSFMTGGNRGITGSPLDRLLSQLIGQPLSVMIILTHGQANAPRIDVVSDYSVIKPADPLPFVAKVGFNAGSVYAADQAFAAKITGNANLMKRMKNMRCEYIRLDDQAVTFLWSGSETDYSSMIMDHGDFYRMINDIMDNLADIADTAKGIGR